MRAFVISALLALSAAPSAAATFSEDFDDGVLDPQLVANFAPGYSLDVTSGRAVITKNAATSTGFANITTSFFLLGDFSATVTADRTLNRTASSGLASSHVNGFTDVYFFGEANVVANIFVGPGFGQTILSDSDPVVDFRIRRVGSTIFEEYDSDQDGTFQIVREATSDALLGEVQISLFMGQEAGNQGEAAIAYDNLTITADAFRNAVPEPATWAMMIAGFGLAGTAARRRTPVRRAGA